jgi:hypothetical protein
LTLSFAFERSRDPRVSAIPPSTETLNVVPENNNYAHLYRPETYGHQATARTLLTLQSIALYVCLAVGVVFKCKRIAA